MRLAVFAIAVLVGCSARATLPRDCPAHVPRLILPSVGSFLTVTENGRTKTRVYDARNRVTSYADGEGNTLGYRYDAAGNLTNLIYPGGQIVAYAYDSHNRLTNVTDWAGRKTLFHYDLAGRVRKIIRPNGTSREVIYDDAGQTREIWERKSDGTPIALFKLQWDAGGRVEHEFIAPLPKPYSEPAVTATYDADNKLATWNGLSIGSGLNYDADGNLTLGPTAHGTPSYSHTWNARNQLTAIGGGLFYRYDSEGNLTGIELPLAEAETNRFAVNPHAALSQVVVRTRQTTAGAVQTLSVYGLGLLYEVDPGSGQARYYHYDYRGSTVAMTDQGQKVTDRVEYSPYGVTTHRTGATDTPFLFNGRYGVMTDRWSGLLHMRARWYNPQLKRFLNPDPIGFAGGMNFYAYADGNPVSYLDPFGLAAVGENGGWSWISRTMDFVDRATLGPESRRLVSEYQEMAGRVRASLPQPVQSTLDYFERGLEASHGIGLGVPMGPGGISGRYGQFSRGPRIPTTVTGFGARAQDVFRSFLASSADDALLGFVQRGKVQLFPAASFEGHLGVVNSGAVRLTRDTMAFQVVRLEGRVSVIRTSEINRMNNFSVEGLLPAQTTAQVKELLGLR